MPRKSDKFNALIQWATSNGTIISPNITFQEISSHNNGATYTAPTDGNTDLLSIPSSILITSETAIDYFKPWGKEVSEKTINVNSLLKLYLCHVCSTDTTNNEFSAYFNILPTLTEIGSPYTWTPGDKELLKGTNLGNSLNETLAQLIEEWWQLINLIPQDYQKPSQHFVNMKFYYEYKFYTSDDYYKYFQEYDETNWTSFVNYLWASLVLKSRSFPAYLTNNLSFAKDSAMLVPVLDMLNHNPKARVVWGFEDGCFKFRNEDGGKVGEEVYNNYGRKGNEELLLAYGFCFEENESDSVALKIKIPEEMLADIQKNGVKLPTTSDYTTSVVRDEDKKEEGEEAKVEDYKDGVLFFITKDHIPENLIQTFQYLVRNELEEESDEGMTLRMKFAGLNHLRAALDQKKKMLKGGDIPKDSNQIHKYIKWYINSQTKIYESSISKIKQIEKDLLKEHKSDLITLKNVYKKDIKFQQSLLLSLGFPSYESIIENQFQDQCWLLWLMRCFNQDEYANEMESEQYLPEWIQELFKKVQQQTKIDPQVIVNYQPIYEMLFPDISTAVPEIYGKGKWTVDEMIIAAKVLDLISFTRGKDQECILVKQDK
ncbi:uncharacterized protein J8A68_000310 [[Candida] subhashii]|uniref:Protein-lysine N-methyltransferase n=1 Tax=[Candida] subhashii TaxID=561895 RepID=A0A8J5UUX9_9ASCO|nr:uncharacterized protein J8A68_000310 [[Candida] subhashii]KAG7666152.1 hypothetical protein J8A68_000310 [[Candida] subhashii]